MTRLERINYGRLRMQRALQRFSDCPGATKPMALVFWVYGWQRVARGE